MKKRFLVLIGCLLIAAFSVHAETPSGAEIVQMVRDTMDVKSSASDVTLTLTDKNGNDSFRRLQLLSMEGTDGLDKSIIVFKSPASVKNTRFLILENTDRDDDQWIFLPSLKKIKRIASGEKSNSFMGTDFSYADMETRDVNDDFHKVLREESIEGKNCWVIESVPKPNTDGVYEKNITWVDKETYLPIKIEFYEEGSGELLKVGNNEEIRMIDGYWTVMRARMTTLSSGHETLMETNQIKYDISIKPGYFTTNFLQTGQAR